MKRVCKYPVYYYESLLLLPNNFRPVKLGMQEGYFYVWIELPIQETHDYDVFSYSFQVHPTGVTIEEDWGYVDTCFADDDTVWHLYYKRNP